MICKKYGKTVLADQTRDTALGVFGSVGGAEVAKYLTPKYTGPYMRGGIKNYRQREWRLSYQHRNIFTFCL